MKQLFVYIFILAFSAQLTAQKDSRAKEILEKSAGNYKNSQGLSAYFTLNIKDIKNKVTQSFDGNILMDGSKFYFSTPDADSWFDGKTQWTYLKDSEEVNITEPSSEEIQLINPSAIYDLYNKNSNYKYIGEKKDLRQRSVYEIELLPKGKNLQIKKIILQLNKTDYIPVMFHVFYDNDIENIVYINTYKTDQNFPDNTFVYDSKKYPDAEVIDLR